MNEPETELARRVVRHLDSGVDHLDAGTRNRLLAARNHALSRYREQPVAAPGLAWVGQAFGHFVVQHGFGARHWFALSALMLALAGVIYWKSTAPVSELAEIDTGLLTDELPINAYLDKGFDSWLKRPSR